jgi:hypothetical protein
VNRRSVLYTTLLTLSSAFVVRAAETPTAFVQRFYDSYLKQKTPDWGGTVKTKRSFFTSALADALQDDIAA